MVLTYVKGDLFTDRRSFLAHCISKDFALGAGIAKQFDKIYNMRYNLKCDYPDAEVGDALLVDNVFNLVTKNRWYHKPTYDALKRSLIDMREQCRELHIQFIAMPKIGCGLDRLDWNVVESIISSVFADTDIIITIYTLD